MKYSAFAQGLKPGLILGGYAGTEVPAYLRNRIPQGLKPRRN